MSNISLNARTLMITCLASGMLLILIIGACLAIAVAQMVDCRGAAFHTQDTIASMIELRASLKSMETGQRGFIITGKDVFLEPYRAEVDTIAGKIERVKSCVGTDAEQQALLKQVDLLTREKLAELKETVELRQTKGFSAAAAVVAAGRGKQYMDDLKAVIKQMISIEQNQLNIENARLDAITKATVGVFVTLAASCIILFCAFGFFMRRYLTDLGLAHQAVTDHKNRLEDFYAILAHELRTPITSVRGSLSLLAGGITGALSDSAKQLVTISLDENDRMLRLINELLDIKKIQEGKFELQLSTVEAQDLVRRSLNGLNGMASEAKVKLVDRVPTDNVAVRCDPDRIVQALTNLISNAIKFSPPDSDVVVSVEPETTQVRFLVKDSGPGIPEEKMGRVFDKFQQLGAQSNYRGTGLGLSISKSIAEVHGGGIGFESKEGLGSTFWLSLPRNKTADQHNA